MTTKWRRNLQNHEQSILKIQFLVKNLLMLDANGITDLHSNEQLKDC